jgi:rifampicin phosphotransferase
MASHRSTIPRSLRRPRGRTPQPGLEPPAPDGAAATILPLGEVSAVEAALVGVKAATLGELCRAGFRIPDGFVITTLAREMDEDAPSGPLAAAIVAAAAMLPSGPLAVRSSSVLEDRADASFAGLYETVLDVDGPEALIEAVGRVWRSAASGRVLDYEADRVARHAPAAIAVLIQPMVKADAAGVAFTADPITGEREVTVVSAVRGVGERLVSGTATPDEWEVRDGLAVARSSPEGAIDAPAAVAVADVALRLQAWAGAPQDVEWALAGGEVVVLQSRPMTALPEPVAWTTDLPGAWLRNFRLGEWLDGPVTPLFASWALTGIERRMHRIYAGWIGIEPPEPAHVVLNGWYFYGFNFMPADRRRMLWDLVRHIVPSLVRRPRRAAMAFPPLARFGIELAHREWRQDLQPAYRARVAAAEAEVGHASPDRLVALVDELVEAAGTYFTSLTAVAGYAAKAALPLATFHRSHLRPVIGGSWLDLLAGLGDGPAPTAGHLVHTIDWIAPPAATGEGADGPGATADERWSAARRARLDVEVTARAALAGNGKRLARFERLLAEAQRFDRAREEQTRELTLPWPVMRRAVLRLGEALAAARRLERPADVFFLRRYEVVSGIAGSEEDLASLVRTRRAAWERQQRLVPPLQVGTVPPMFQRLVDGYVAAMRDPVADAGAMVGIPASSGRAAGPARIVRGPADFGRVQQGDILVASMTTPAWTPLFHRVAAVVTDNGGVGAHASIVAREYGIPAVVGLGDVTAMLHDGDQVEVDGGAGTVRRAGATR